MKAIHRASGLEIKTPSTYSVADLSESIESRRRGAPSRVFGPVALPHDQEIAGGIDDAVASAFSGQDMQLVDQIELRPKPKARNRKSPDKSSSPVDNTIELALPVEPQEDAVLLLEQDGVYSWNFPQKSRNVAQGNRRRADEVGVQRLIHFSIRVSTEKSAKRRRAQRGIIEDFIVDKIKVFVFRFAARVAVGQVMKYLERHQRRGLIQITDVQDPGQWSLVAESASFHAPEVRPARILLFVHGTFSSTIGAYGPLTATPWGQEFLRAAQANYDMVLGFDHPTLSEDPLENAAGLLHSLQQLNLKFPPHLDVITHSRGGLVIRSFVEQLLPMDEYQVHVDRIIFVAATNGGTLLAEPDNWHTMIDLYTNIAVAACKLVGMYPQAKAVALILKEIVSGLGAFVKYCTTTAIHERSVPGLAAMEPDGEFITKLNEQQESQPTVEQTYYCAVTSEFRPRIFGGDHEPKEFPYRLVLWIADVFARKILKDANDLAVDVISMTSVDPQVGKYIKDSLDFGVNPQVYHTNYFIRPEVINALAKWLRLAQPMVVTQSPRRRTVKESLRGPSSVYGFDLLDLGGVIGPEVPAVVDTNIMITTANVPFGETVDQIRLTNPSFVVVQRDYQNQLLNYAFAAEEVIARGWGVQAEAPLIDALDLHETDQSQNRLIGSPMVPGPVSQGSVTAGRAVVLSNNRPVGVLPQKTDLPGASELIELARTVSSPRTDQERIQARRTMPSFSTSHPGGTADWLPPIPPDPPKRRRRAVSPPSSTETKHEVTCHFRAEMDQTVVVGRRTTVEVLVSREVIGQVLGPAADEGQAEVDLSRKLMIQVLPKVNFETVDEGWVEIEPPQPGVPQPLYFQLKATHEGGGEVWMIARQGHIPLVTLVLKPEIVAKEIPSRRATASATTPEAPRSEPGMDQLFILEQRNGNELHYFLQLQVPGLDLKWGTSKPIDGHVSTYVEFLYKEIENRWLSNKDDVENFVEELRAMGANMRNQLLPPQIQDTLWEFRDQIKSIMVISEEPFIPWELVHLGEPGKSLPKELRFLGQMGLVRWLHEAGWPRRQLRLRQNKARYVIPHYPHPDYKLPEAEQEANFLKKRLGAKPIGPNSKEVRKLLSQPGSFDLLHFACHGIASHDNIANAQLVLEGRIEDQNYIPDYFSATTAEHHSNLKEDVHGPLIVLNACQAGRAGYQLTGIGGFARAFLRRGASAFISTLWSVGDSPAREFTEEFYRELLAGKTIAEATIKAREKARQAGDATWLAYVVYGHPHAAIEN
jgi:hypothetical protein